MRGPMAILGLVALVAASCGGGTSGDSPFDQAATPGDASQAVTDLSNDVSTEVASGSDGFLVETSDDGFDISRGAGTEVPADFPMPLFTPNEVIFSSRFDDGTTLTFILTISVPVELGDEALQFYADWHAQNGFDVGTDNPGYLEAYRSDAGSSAQLLDYTDHAEINLAWQPLS